MTSTVERAEPGEPGEPDVQDVQDAMTRADLARRVGGIAVPILLGSLASLVAPLINAAVLGRHNSSYLYILALVLPVILLQNSVNDSLRVSSVVFSSQASGSGDLATFRGRLRSLIILGVSLNLLVAVAFFAGHGAFMDLYAVPAGRQPLAFEYIQANIATGTLLMVSMAMASALYGFGQVRAVTVVTVISLASNVLLTATLVSWIGLFALPVSTTVTATCTICWAARRLAGVGAVPWRGGHVLDALREAWPMICRISVPVSLGYLVLFVNSTIFTHILALYSPTDVAGFGIAYRIQNLVLLPGIAIGVGLAVNVNRMVAAKQHGQVSRLVTTSVTASLAVFIILGALVFTTRHLSTALMTGDPSIAGAARQYLTYLAPAYLLLGPLATMLIFLEETGNGFRALRFNIALVAAQLGAAFWLAHSHHALQLIYLVLSASYLAAAIFIVHELVRVRRLGGRVSIINRA